MLASWEPRINSLSKCVPSVLVLVRTVFRSEEHAVRAYFRFNVSVSSLCGFRVSRLSVPLPSPSKTRIISARLTLKPATCSAPARLHHPQSRLPHCLRTLSLSDFSFSSPVSFCSARSY